MKVYYDYQVLCGQRYGGISRYFFELISKIQDMKLADASIEAIRSKNVYFFERFGIKTYPNTNNYIEKVVQIVNRVYALHKMRGFDIIHPTYYSPYVLRHKKGKIVLTVYDMTHEKYPDLFNDHGKTIRRKKKMIYGSDHIIAISESTKKDILEFYPDIPEDKISVIYIGCSLNTDGIEFEEKPLPENYILYVGRREHYKNFENFFVAMKRLFDLHPDLKLVLIGGGKITENESKQIGKYRNRVIQMDASDKLLALAYTNAKCFVFPSLYEGFGIPTLEAFKCGCPVLLSRASSLPEVGGDAAEYFDPLNPVDMSEKIESVISNDIKRTEMIERGKIQLKNFSWENIAMQTVNVYEATLKGMNKPLK